MENDLWLGFEKCRVDLVFVCDVHFMIFDGGETILNGVQIEDRDLRRRVKFEQRLDDSMAERATAPNEG
jgi:hypothetical protein